MMIPSGSNTSALVVAVLMSHLSSTAVYVSQARCNRRGIVLALILICSFPSDIFCFAPISVQPHLLSFDTHCQQQHHLDGKILDRDRPYRSMIKLQAMQIWLDARTVSPAESNRIDEADVLLTTEDVPSPFPSDSFKPNFTTSNNTNKLTSEGEDIMGIVVDIANSSGQDEALAAVGSVEWILAICHGEWRMIPAENLIAAARSAGTKLAIAVERVEDVVGLSRALELGVDALCVAADANDDLWNAAIEARTERNVNADTSQEIVSKKAQIVTGICWRQQTKGASTALADRVCVDFVQTLKSTEGCWIGSSAKVMALILSEAAISSFVPSRPFRVNAGPVHSYIVLGDGVSTKYLCELQAGEEVLVYDSASGRSRSVAVGRLKIEVRPCVVVGLKILLSEENRKKVADAQVFLQQAETVRLGKENGNFLRVTELAVQSNESSSLETCENNDETILLRVTDAGTHVGKAYTGRVLER